jgi:hypothetical protein
MNGRRDLDELGRLDLPQECVHMLLALLSWAFASAPLVRMVLGERVAPSLLLVPVLLGAGAMHYILFSSPERYRLFCFGSSFLAFFTPLLAYFFYVAWLGFPDGHRTTFEHAIESLYPLFCITLCGIGLGYLRLGWIGRHEDRRPGASLALASLVLFLVLASLAEVSLHSVLEDGTGG